MVPTAIALGLDDRTLRGVSVWLKPLKFMLSIGVLSLTTAWFIGHLPRQHRRGRWVTAVAAMVIGAGAFELAYITVQAARGLGSHYNVSDTFHAVMYQLMGLGAVVLTASQPLLAWLLAPSDARIPPVYRASVLAGLVLTFVLGGGVGALLSGLQPPAVAGMPFFGWSPSSGDLRPAHFLGLHSEHLLPAAGLVLATYLPLAAGPGLRRSRCCTSWPSARSSRWPCWHARRLERPCHCRDRRGDKSSARTTNTAGSGMATSALCSHGHASGARAHLSTPGVAR